MDKETVYTLEHPLNISKVEEHLYKDTQNFPKLEPGIKQRTWEVRTSIPPISHIPSLVWINKDHIPSDQFWEAFASDSLQDQRQQVRRRYIKEYWEEGEKTLKELSLQAYSSEQYRSIDSIELIFKIETQENLYHRVTIEGNRGIPIRYSTLKPYSRQEIQLLVNTSYQDWYKAGGYFHQKFYRAYPNFWIDFWTIVPQEYPIILKWFLPEVEEVDMQDLEEEEESSQQGIK